jgi:hypothetical protein
MLVPCRPIFFLLSDSLQRAPTATTCCWTTSTTTRIFIGGGLGFIKDGKIATQLTWRWTAVVVAINDENHISGPVTAKPKVKLDGKVAEMVEHGWGVATTGNDNTRGEGVGLPLHDYRIWRFFPSR